MRAPTSIQCAHLHPFNARIEWMSGLLSSYPSYSSLPVTDSSLLTRRQAAPTSIQCARCRVGSVLPLSRCIHAALGRRLRIKKYGFQEAVEMFAASLCFKSRSTPGYAAPQVMLSTPAAGPAGAAVEMFAVSLCSKAGRLPVMLHSRLCSITTPQLVHPRSWSGPHFRAACIPRSAAACTALPALSRKHDGALSSLLKPYCFKRPLKAVKSA
jgi:hypothetical protein